MCPLSCGTGTHGPEGRHIEAWIDATTGAGIDEVDVDHDYLASLTIAFDPGSKSVHVTGLGCP